MILRFWYLEYMCIHIHREYELYIIHGFTISDDKTFMFSTNQDVGLELSRALNAKLRNAKLRRHGSGAKLLWCRRVSRCAPWRFPFSQKKFTL